MAPALIKTHTRTQSGTKSILSVLRRSEESPWHPFRHKNEELVENEAIVSDTL